MFIRCLRCSTSYLADRTPDGPGFICTKCREPKPSPKSEPRTQSPPTATQQPPKLVSFPCRGCQAMMCGTTGERARCRGCKWVNDVPPTDEPMPVRTRSGLVITPPVPAPSSETVEPRSTTPNTEQSAVKPAPAAAPIGAPPAEPSLNVRRKKNSAPPTIVFPCRRCSEPISGPQGGHAGCKKCKGVNEVPFADDPARVSRTSSPSTAVPGKQTPTVPAEATTVPPAPAESSILVRCPACAATYRLPSTARGKRAKCSRCKVVFTVPQAPTRTAESNEWRRALAKAPSLTPVPAGGVDARPERRVSFFCQFCSTAVSGVPGQVVRCSHCARSNPAPAESQSDPNAPRSLYCRCGRTYHGRPSDHCECPACESKSAQAATLAGGARSGSAKTWSLPDEFGAVVWYGLLGLAIIAAIVVTVTKERPARNLTDDERIERMEREQEKLRELNEWHQKKLRAEEWDRLKGR